MTDRRCGYCRKSPGMFGAMTACRTQPKLKKPIATSISSTSTPENVCWPKLLQFSTFMMGWVAGPVWTLLVVFDAHAPGQGVGVNRQPAQGLAGPMGSPAGVHRVRLRPAAYSPLERAAVSISPRSALIFPLSTGAKIGPFPAAHVYLRAILSETDR